MIIRVVDLETTGFPPDADPIEIATIDVMADAFCSPKISDDWRQSLIRPTRPIPPVASAVHHLIDADVADAAPWAEVWPFFVEGRPDYWCAHTAKMERAFLTDDLIGGMPWIDTWKCAMRLFPQAPSFSNQALRYWLNPPGIDRARAAFAHRAGPDAYVTAHLLAVMIERASIEQLAAWSAEPALLPRVPFGMSRGASWQDVDDGFLDWVLARDFDEDVLFTARTERNRRRAEWQAANAASASA